MKDKNTKKLYIIISCATLAAAMAIVLGIYNAPVNRFARHLDLGQKYLTELNYEQAIAEFNKAIEIDPMSVDAYLGLTEVYLVLGNRDDALDILKKGYEITQDERLQEMINGIEAEIEAEQEVAEEETEIQYAEEVDDQVYVEFPFELTDFKLAGYDVMNDNFQSLVDYFDVAVYPSSEIVPKAITDGNVNELIGAAEYDGKKNFTIDANLLVDENGSSSEGTFDVEFYYAIGYYVTDTQISLKLANGGTQSDVTANLMSSGAQPEYIESPIPFNTDMNEIKRMIQWESIERSKAVEEKDGSIWHHFQSNLGEVTATINGKSTWNDEDYEFLILDFDGGKYRLQFFYCVATQKLQNWFIRQKLSDL